MKRLRNLGFVVFTLIFIGCGNTDKIPKGEGSTGEKNAIMVTDREPYQNSASTNILNVTLEGDLLALDVSYSGGCEEHSFELLGNPYLMKSFPPKRGVQLYHNSNGDSCRELIEETLLFNISILGVPNGEVHLMLDGWDGGVIPY